MHSRMAKIRKTDHIKHWQGCEATETLIQLEIKHATPTLENSFAIS